MNKSCQSVVDYSSNVIKINKMQVEMQQVYYNIFNIQIMLVRMRLSSLPT